MQEVGWRTREVEEVGRAREVDTHSHKSVSKETYYCVKRDLLQCQKRPTTVSKETYYSVKRDISVKREKWTHQSQHTPHTHHTHRCVETYADYPTSI